MKKIIPIIALFITSNAFSQIRSVSLQAGGLTCSMCSRAIYKSLLKVPSVAKVIEDIQHTSYTVEFKDHQPIVLEDLKRAVKDAGFSMLKMEVRADFAKTDIPGDGALHINGVSFVLVGTTATQLVGEKTLVLVDKDFLPEKERQKYLPLIKNDNSKAYHVIIRQS